MPDYVQFEEVRDNLPNPSPESYPDIRRFIREAESRVRVQVGRLPSRNTEDGEFVAGVIRDIAIARALFKFSGNAALIEKARALREGAGESLVVLMANADTPDAQPETGAMADLIGGGVDLFGADDYTTNRHGTGSILDDERRGRYRR